MKRLLTEAEVNHLRRLVAWIRCEYYMEPDEIVRLVRDQVAVIGEPSDEGKKRLLAFHTETKRVPKYVRAAIKALHKTIDDNTTRKLTEVETGPVRIEYRK